LGILFISNIRVKKPDISKLFSRKKIWFLYHIFFNYKKYTKMT
jgi:hypothetical protein